MKYNFFSASKVALPLILLSSQTLTAFAADDVKLAKDGGLELTITANRRLQNINQSLAATSIINSKTIEQSQATNITEVLRLVPGLTFKIAVVRARRLQFICVAQIQAMFWY